MRMITNASKPVYDQVQEGEEQIDAGMSDAYFPEGSGNSRIPQDPEKQQPADQDAHALQRMGLRVPKSEGSIHAERYAIAGLNGSGSRCRSLPATPLGSCARILYVNTLPGNGCHPGSCRSSLVAANRNGRSPLPAIKTSNSKALDADAAA